MLISPSIPVAHGSRHISCNTELHELLDGTQQKITHGGKDKKARTSAADAKAAHLKDAVGWIAQIQRHAADKHEHQRNQRRDSKLQEVEDDLRLPWARKNSKK